MLPRINPSRDISTEPITIDEINAARKLAEKEYQALTTDKIKHLRLLCKNDLYFLNYGILGHTKLSVNLHGHYCLWLQSTDHYQFRLTLLPRGNYKSTIKTIADSIRIVLPDDGGISTWPRNLGTNCRLLICHEVVEQAAKFLGPITQHFTLNPLLIGLFSECVPDPRKQRVNKFELDLPRTDIWSEPTIDTMGVGNSGQGRHYNYIIADDLIGQKACDSATEMANAKDWFDGIQSFFSTFKDDHLDIVGTRYSLDDLYAHMMEVYGDELHKYIRSMEERNPKTGLIESIFPEEFPLNRLNVLKKNPKKYSAQYANDPQLSSTEFVPSWLKYYTWRNAYHVQYQFGLNNVSVNTLDCDKVIIVDPAMSGFSGLVVTASNNLNKIFLLEAKQHTWRPPELVNEIFQLVMKWKPRCVYFEEVLFSGIFKNWFQSEMKLRKYWFNIETVKATNRAKEARVRGLSNYFQAGQIFANQGQLDFIEQYKKFGAIQEYHILDALGYGPEVWKPGIDKKTFDQYQKLQDEMLDRFDPLTGYSR